MAMPGKIIEIDDDLATVEYPGQTREAKIIEGSYNIGDYVFVSAQIIVQKIPEQEALESLRSWDDVA